MTTAAQERGPRARFRHEMATYDGAECFVDVVAPFVREGVEVGAAVLVAAPGDRLRRLRSALGRAEVEYVDLARVGRNPARIVSLWRDFVDRQVRRGRPVRGVGEPVWAGRNPAELVECERHEALLDLAFADDPGWWLLCPYDERALPAEVVDRAAASHRSVLRDGVRHDRGPVEPPTVETTFAGELPEPTGPVTKLPFRAGDLALVRDAVLRHARQAGLAAGPSADLVLAANEVATNSLRHGGGQGTVRLWVEPDVLVCEVRDRGRMTDPLVGRVRPPYERAGGRGVWLANQLCDLVQVRSSAAGTVVRLHVRR